MDFTRALYYKSPIMTGNDVRYVQERLKELGYYTGSIDGSFGPACRRAVIHFQKTNLLEPDGSLGPITWNVLFSSNAVAVFTYTRALYYTSPVMVGQDVTYVQRRLKLLGFYTGLVDGSFGPACNQAVMDFQRANGLGIDGSVGPATWEKLFGNNVNTSIQYTRALYYTRPVMTGSDVTHVQNALKSLGFYTGEIDGSFGTLCNQAVINFQRENGLDVDGSVGPATWNKLFSDTSAGQVSYTRALYYTIPIRTGDDVVKVQKKLKELGFYKDAIDGSFGPACDLATRNFQRANGLEVDGSVGPLTWSKLFSDNVNSEMKYTRALHYTSPVMTGNDVTHVQKRLKELGFYNGGIDGSFGPGCDEAIRNFQRANGLAVDGSVGPATWEKLFNDAASTELVYTRALYYTSPVMTGNDVIHVQKRLQALGFYGGIIDGSFGPACRQAVMEFQRANKLAVDGSVGPATWNKLFGIDSSGGMGNLGNIKKVFIDPGHGGSDPGALGNGLKEKDITLSMALKLGNLLQAKGMSVKYSRTTDKYVSLQNRASQANAWGADLFVSIHCNAFKSSSAHGTECFTHPSASASTKALSRNVSNDMAKSLGLRNRGHKEANFAVLRLSNMPAILTETAFITNSSDASKLNSGQNEFVSSLASQIIGANVELPDATKEIIRYASRNGLFKGLGVDVETFNTKSPVQLISIRPKVTLQVELSATTTFPIPAKQEVLNLSLTSNEIEVSFLDKLGSTGVVFGPGMNLQMPINRLKATQDIDRIVKYSVQNKLDFLEVIMEAALPIGDTTVYQRFIYNIYRNPLDFAYSTVMVPTGSRDGSGEILPEIIKTAVVVSAIAIVAGVVFVGMTGGWGALNACKLIPLFVRP